ncbi:hypothetical protein B0H14DRAFT_2618829 [Mycena olivaceomarginata]|nr:hypothetical protein B0H14DRAFT_2618829 [Mycena olivaceomarginata]
MTHLNSPAPGTGNSVPEAVNKDQTTAALQAMWAAMQQLGQGAGRHLFCSPLRLWPPPRPRLPRPPPALRSRHPRVPLLPPAHGSLALFYHVVPPTPLGLTTFGENEPEGPWYSITRGLHVGVTINNAIAVGAISGVSRGAMSKHKTQPQAVAAFNEALHPLVSSLSFMSDGRRVNA